MGSTGSSGDGFGVSLVLFLATRGERTLILVRGDGVEGGFGRLGDVPNRWSVAPVLPRERFSRGDWATTGFDAGFGLERCPRGDCWVAAGFDAVKRFPVVGVGLFVIGGVKGFPVVGVERFPVGVDGLTADFRVGVLFLGLSSLFCCSLVALFRTALRKSRKR